MASRTLHGVPLSLLLDKIKKEIFLLKQICESAYDHEYILKGYKLINESEELINILKKCDSKVKSLLTLLKIQILIFNISYRQQNNKVFFKLQLQQYLSISNITPHLIKLESAIDKYVTNVELLPTKKSFLPDLSIFSLVAKLLTGELLGYESIDPNYVLIENMPKKPVFIIKNVKRKTIYPYYPT